MIAMIIKYFQMAKDVRIIKRHLFPNSNFKTLNEAVLGDKEATKKLLLSDFHHTVGVLASKGDLDAKNYAYYYEEFVKSVEKVGAEFSEEELARVADYTLFRRLYKYC